MSTSDEKHAPDPMVADQGAGPEDAAAPTARDDETVGADLADEHAHGGGAGGTPDSPVTTPTPDLATSPPPDRGTAPAPGTRPTPETGTDPAAAAPKPVPEPGPPAVPPVPPTPAPRPTTGPGPIAPPVSTPVAPPGPAPLAPVRPALTAEDEATARHAAGRPLPVPPDPPTTPVPPSAAAPRPSGSATTGPVGAGAGLPGAVAPSGSAAAAGAAGATRMVGAAAAGAAAGAAAAGSAAGAGMPTPMTGGQERSDRLTGSAPDLFPDPNAPRTITVGTHALGVIVGILLPLASMLVTTLGISRILAVEADGWAAKVDVLGIVLVTLGALLLLACALLSLWTPAVGLVGGSILTLAGGFALYAPGLTRTGVLDVLTSEGWQPTVVQSVVVATSGTFLVVGLLLLGSGIVSTAARRHGIHLGAFRERHRA